MNFALLFLITLFTGILSALPQPNRTEIKTRYMYGNEQCNLNPSANINLCGAGTMWSTTAGDSGGQCVDLGYKFLSTFVDTMSASNSGMVTYQFGVKLKGGAATVYTIIGSSKGSMVIPAGWQKKTFGKNLGGVNKDIVKIFKDAGYDSWLTVGLTGGDGSNELGSAGLKDSLKAWSPASGGFGKGFTNGDCDIFWMNPAKSRAKGKIVLGQITLKKGVNFSAQMGVAGKMDNGKTWREDKVFW